MMQAVMQMTPDQRKALRDQLDKSLEVHHIGIVHSTSRKMVDGLQCKRERAIIHYEQLGDFSLAEEISLYMSRADFDQAKLLEMIVGYQSLRRSRLKQFLYLRRPYVGIIGLEDDFPFGEHKSLVTRLAVEIKCVITIHRGTVTHDHMTVHTNDNIHLSHEGDQIVFFVGSQAKLVKSKEKITECMHCGTTTETTWTADACLLDCE